MREMLLTHKDILLKLEQLESQTLRNTEDIQAVFDQLKQFLIPVEQAERPEDGFSLGVQLAIELCAGWTTMRGDLWGGRLTAQTFALGANPQMPRSILV